MAAPFLEARNVSKRFGPVEAWAKALPSILLSQVRALLGENGAGTSTWMTMSKIQPI